MFAPKGHIFGDHEGFCITLCSGPQELSSFPADAGNVPGSQASQGPSKPGAGGGFHSYKQNNNEERSA